MDLSTTWEPSNNGIPLLPFKLTKEIEDDCLVPNIKDHEHWVKRTLGPLLSSISQGQDEVWTSVLTLWRLKHLEGDLENTTEEFMTTWQLFTSVWLVRSPLGMCIGV